MPVYFSPHAAPGLGPRSAWGLRPGWLLKGWLAATAQRIGSQRIHVRANAMSLLILSPTP